jgi:hypothetical protein
LISIREGASIVTISPVQVDYSLRHARLTALRTAEVDAYLQEGGGPFWFVPQESLPGRLKEGLLGKAQVEEISIEPGCGCDGKLVKDVHWPKHFVIASVRRGEQILIPKVER